MPAHGQRILLTCPLMLSLHNILPALLLPTSMTLLLVLLGFSSAQRRSAGPVSLCSGPRALPWSATRRCA